MTDTQLSPDTAHSRRFRASTYDEAVVAATDELGSGIEVVEANRIRRGGLGGFFATDLGIEITVVPAHGPADAAADGEPDARPIRPYLPQDLSPDPAPAGERGAGALPGQSLGMTDEGLQQLLDRVERASAADGVRASFADLLSDVARAVDEPDATADAAADPTTELPRIEAATPPATPAEPVADRPRLPSRHHRAAARSAPCGFAGATGAFDRAAPFAEDATVAFTAPFDAPLEDPFDEPFDEVAGVLDEPFDEPFDELPVAEVAGPDEPFDWTGVTDETPDVDVDESTDDGSIDVEESTDVAEIARMVTERITAELTAERAGGVDPVAVVMPMDDRAIPDPPTDVLAAAAEQLVRELGRIPVTAGSPLHDLDRLRVAVTTPDGNRIEMAVELGAGGD